MQRAVDFPFRAWSWVTGSFADRGRLRQENLELTARLRLANLQLQRFAALEDENRRLREMRANTAGVAEKVLVASILNVDLDPFRHRVLLDKGAVDGVFQGQAVLDGEGIFGQVTKVNAGTAEVILISDPEHAIPVQSNRSGVRTIAVGTGDSNKLSLAVRDGRSRPATRRPAAVDRPGRRLPAGLSRWRRSRRSSAPAARSRLVEARPTAQLDRDREVLLAWFKPARHAQRTCAPPPRHARTRAGRRRHARRRRRTAAPTAPADAAGDRAGTGGPTLRPAATRPTPPADRASRPGAGE